MRASHTARLSQTLLVLRKSCYKIYQFRANITNTGCGLSSRLAISIQLEYNVNPSRMEHIRKRFFTWLSRVPCGDKDIDNVFALHEPVRKHVTFCHLTKLFSTFGSSLDVRIFEQHFRGSTL